MKKVFMHTFGCQMNERDSEVIKGLLLDKGFEMADFADEASIVLLNTCSVRQHAEDRVWSEIGRLSQLEHRPIIGLLGCMAENHREEAFKKAPGIGLVVGPNNIDAIPLLLIEILKGQGEKVLAVGKRERDEFVYKTDFRQDKDRAYVVISEGCNNFCSYCVVPYVRGALRNRHQESILAEIKKNIEKGITRITLLGQNVNAYCCETKDFDFVRLLEEISSLAGLKELTFMTSHPKDASVRLFEAIARLDKVKKGLHLPVQSGSDRILGMMNRGYTREKYIKLAEEYRRTVPAGLLSTDIIVGFPTETKEDFLDTFELMKKLEFNAAYIFKYSPRPHTKAEALPDDVPKKEKERRHKILLDYQRGLAHVKVV